MYLKELRLAELRSLLQKVRYLLQAKKEIADWVLPGAPDGGGEEQGNLGCLQERDWGLGLPSPRWGME